MEAEVHARRWARLRLALGVLQMGGAIAGLMLVASSGLTRSALAVALATTFATTVSVLLFGSRSR
jgi:hypothetical protein